MKTHRLVSVAFLVSSIFCSSLNAQTDQPVAVQLSGLFNRTDTNDRWEWGGEGQVRWTGEAWSLGVGVQYTHSQQNLNLIGFGGFEDPAFGSYDYGVSTLGLFLEPRFVFMAFADRFGLYLHGRVAVSRVSENESGQLPVFDMFGNPVALDPYTLEANSFIAPSAFLGPGLLMRLNSRVNLDLGFTGGYAWWGDRTRVPDVSSRPKFFFSMGGRVGIVIGIG